MLNIDLTDRMHLIRTLKHLTSFVSFSLFTAILLLSIGCGKRGAPVPPKERVLQRVELSGYQRGNQVLLSWRMPARNAPKGDVLNISRADIYRLAEPASAPQQMTEEEFANRSTLITSMVITNADFGSKTLVFKDVLEFAGQAARLRYAVRLVNATGQKAAFSNSLLIEPTSKVAGGPTSLLAIASQEAVRLKWQAPLQNIDGSVPVSILGYNIYRSVSDKEPAQPLNKTPVTKTEFDDEFFEFGKDYYYFVRSVSVGTGAEPIESAESNILKFKPVDTFAPTAPAAITLAATPASISIFFAVNPEKDVVGYKIYRSTDKALPIASWTLLTPELLKSNTFQDTRVEPGKTYYYCLTATDKFGNVSEVSDIVSETVP